MTAKIQLYINSVTHVKLETSSLREDFQYTLEMMAMDWEERKILEESHVARIGDYEFDIEDIEGYSESTKTFLEEIMEVDDEEKLGLFYKFSKSSDSYLLDEEDVDLESILEKFQMENTEKNKTIEKFMTLEATAISQSTL